MRIPATMPADWSRSRFLVVVASLQIAYAGSIVGRSILDYGSFSLAMVLLSSLFVVVVPGNVILRLLRPKGLTAVEEVLYSVGLSISLIMFLGFSMNTILPFAGISKPLSVLPMQLGILFSTASFTAAVFLRERRYERIQIISTEVDLHPKQLFFAMFIVILSVLGATFINTFGDNTFALVFQVLVAAIPLLVALDRIPQAIYPVLIFSIALGVLLQKSLISQYLTGWDVYMEHYYSTQVLSSSIWEDVGNDSNLATLLSTNIFAPVYSELSGMSLTWVFKIVYPVLFALVPLALYQLFATHFSKKVAFLAAFVSVSLYVFSQAMVDVPRQELGELFMVLVMYVGLRNDNIIPYGSMPSRALALVFVSSLVVSHYALSFLFLFLVVCASVVAVFWHEKSRTTFLVKPGFVVLLSSMIFVWYANISTSRVFDQIVDIGADVYSGLFDNFLTNESSQAVYVTSTEMDPFHMFTMYLNLAVLGLILIGVIHLASRRNRHPGSKSYISFAFASVILLAAGVILPYFASSVNFFRIYQISLLVLSPAAIIGFMLLERATQRMRTRRAIDAVIGTFLAVFLVSNSGLLYEMSGESSYISVNADMDYPKYSFQEVVGAEWLAASNGSHLPTFADDYRWQVLLAAGVDSFSVGGYEAPFPPTEDAYIYLGRENTQNQRQVTANWSTPTSPVLVSESIYDSDLWHVLQSSALIYSSGDSMIYYLQS